MNDREQFEARWRDFHTTGLVSQKQFAWLVWQAARAQAAQAGQVPMTDAQIEHALRAEPMVDNEESFALGIRAAERHHGIVGEKGGAL